MFTLETQQPVLSVAISTSIKHVDVVAVAAVAVHPSGVCAHVDVVAYGRGNKGHGDPAGNPRVDRPPACVHQSGGRRRISACLRDQYQLPCLGIFWLGLVELLSSWPCSFAIG